MSRDFEDFTDAVQRSIRSSAGKSQFVDDVYAIIRGERGAGDLANDVIRDFFDDADYDGKVFNGNRVDERLVEDCESAVLATIVDKYFTESELDRISDKITRQLADGMNEYSRVIDRVTRNDRRRDRDRYDSRRDRYDDRRRDDRDRRRDYDSRDRDDRRRRDDRRSRDDRRDRDRRDDTRRNRDERYERTRENNRERREDNRGRNDSSSSRRSRDYGRQTQQTNTDSITSAERKLLDELADLDLKTMAFIKDNLEDIRTYMDHQDEFETYLADKNKEVYGGPLDNRGIGMASDTDLVLKDGVVVDVEEYMEHELDRDARLANRERYGLSVAKPIPVPVTTEEEETFKKVETVTYMDAGAREHDRIRSDLVDYTDLTSAALEDLAPLGDMVTASYEIKTQHSLDTTMVERLLPKEAGVFTAPFSWDDVHTLLGKMHTMYTNDPELSPEVRRFASELDEMATASFNQLLVMIDASFQIENFGEDYTDGIEALKNQDRSVRQDFDRYSTRYFRDNYHFKVATGVIPELTTITISRNVQVLYTFDPMVCDNVRFSLDDRTLCVMSRSNAPKSYDILASVLRKRKGLTDAVFVDGLRNFYAACCTEPAGGALITLREI